ncbi:cytokinin riboside 5'-monophosphate phosphoribohydrolase LOG [Copromyces sp. CBS 386.78]|nr:cytokinin riboside 5'-monophosphate phosphoribohydrolase LOG [Copromyces sp. CBS 386.78]
MGEIAKTLVSLSGPDSVHGIIPEALVRYERDPNYTSAHTNGTQKDGTAEDEEKAKQLAVPDENVFGRTTIVKDMHTRKLMMAQEVLAGGPGSGFIAMSGGYGTMEELFETVTWNQLGIHDKGIVLLNINGFYDGILQWIQNSIKEGFVNQANGKIMVEAKNPEDAIKALREYKVSEAVLKLKWSDE